MVPWASVPDPRAANFPFLPKEEGKRRRPRPLVTKKFSGRNASGGDPNVIGAKTSLSTGNAAHTIVGRSAENMPRSLVWREPDCGSLDDENLFSDSRASVMTN